MRGLRSADHGDGHAVLRGRRDPGASGGLASWVPTSRVRSCRSADAARTIHAADPTKYLATFPANDAQLFAALSAQAGAEWWFDVAGPNTTYRGGMVRTAVLVLRRPCDAFRPRPDCGRTE